MLTWLKEGIGNALIAEGRRLVKMQNSSENKIYEDILNYM